MLDLTKMAKQKEKGDAETKALEILLRFLNKRPIHFGSVEVALCSLEAGRKFKVSGFDIHAVSFIQRNLTTDCALNVLEKVIRFSSLCGCKKEVIRPPVGHHPSAPAAEEFDREYLEDKLTAEQNKMNAKQEMFDKVIKNSLKIIDENANQILKSEGFEIIPLKLMHFLLKRDSLCVESELNVLRALDRWARMQCFLQNRPPSPSNKQDVLCGAQYLVRYLTMSPAQIKLGQAQCGLLRDKEVFSILKTVSHPKCTCPLNKRLQGIRKKLATPRLKYTPEYEYDSIDDLKKTLKTEKPWDCEAQEYRINMDNFKEIEEKDYEHIGDCVEEVPDEGDEVENIYQTIDGPEIEMATKGSFQWKNQTPKLKEKRCTCVRVKRSRTVHNEAELQKYRAFYQRGGRYSRERVWSNGSNESGHGHNTIQTQEFNTLEKIFYCLACMFD